MVGARGVCGCCVSVRKGAAQLWGLPSPSTKFPPFVGIWSYYGEYIYNATYSVSELKPSQGPGAEAEGHFGALGATHFFAAPLRTHTTHIHPLLQQQPLLPLTLPPPTGRTPALSVPHVAHTPPSAAHRPAVEGCCGFRFPHLGALGGVHFFAAPTRWATRGPSPACKTRPKERGANVHWEEEGGGKLESILLSQEGHQQPPPWEQPYSE